jgi:threonine/homoserine/homoserine lactone efflux protein
MSWHALLTGGILGFSIAAPVGPVGALTIRRTLAQGRLAGFLTGLGAATADSFYGAVAAFGLTVVTGFLIAQQGWLTLAGGLFLCYLGAATFLAKPVPIEHAPPISTLLGAYASTVLLTLTNPATILSFMGIYAALGLRDAVAGYGGASAFVVGVFAGSAAWWLLLSFGVGALRERVTTNGLRWINRASGALIAVFGALVLLVRD